MRRKLLSVLLTTLAPFICFGTAKPLFKDIDISKVANASTNAGIFKFENFPTSSQMQNFGKIDFKILSISASNRKNAILLNASNKKINIKLENNKFNYRYLYILHTISGGNNAKGKFATIKLSGGKSFQAFYLKNEFEGARFLQKDFLENAVCVFSSDKENGKGNLYLSSFPIVYMSDPIENIEIEYNNKKNDWEIVAMTLSDRRITTGKSFTVDESKWKAIDPCREIVEGSALDMSNLMTEKPAGKYGRLIVNKDGHFEFEKNKGVRVKFKGTNDRPAYAFGNTLKTHDDIDKMVRQYRKQGYNMLRWRISMIGSREFESAYKMKKEVRDMYDYFIYALAREGIYTHWMFASHDLGNPDFKWSDRFDVKCKFIFGDPKTREDWRKFVIMQMNHVNPYTGKAWKDDMSIATVEYFNELDTLYPFHRGMSAEGRNFGDKVFRQWIEKRYANIEALNEAWKMETPFKSFAEVSPFNKAEHRTCLKDISQFIIHYSRDMREFCEKVVREEVGFTAPIHQNNCAVRTDVYFLSAETGTYMANNLYYTHPTAFMSAGSMVSQLPSIRLNYDGAYWLHAANKKMADRPFCVTEYQHSHWNPYKHEAGVFFPAYSAYQNFDTLVIHDQAVSSYPARTLSCFEVSDSPVYRANEFLSCMLFYRGDVSPANKRVEVVYDKEYIENNSNVAKGMSHEQAKIAYMTGFSIAFPSARKIGDLKNVDVKPADLQMKPEGSARLCWSNEANPADIEKMYFDISEAANTLKTKDILDEDNISDPSNGIYQTDTKQITTNFKEGWVKVKTPKTEAIVWKVGMKSTKIGRLNIISSDESASIALTSVDNKPLKKSKRMVLVYNTDNTSTGVELSLDRKILKNHGKIPILVKTGKLLVEIKLPRKKILGAVSEKGYKVYALKMNGERIDEIPFKIEKGIMKLDIDTAKLSEPALYYEIIKE